MGVDGLWKILQPAAEPRSILHLSVRDGFEANPAGQRAYRVGIDTSIWLLSVLRKYDGENAELLILYHRCCRLLALPILPLFVFDGPHRPSVKRGRFIRPRPHWLEASMKAMIEAFGFAWWTAPGEADAELVYLNRSGILEAVMSEDVDTLVFGAATVLRSPPIPQSKTNANPIATGKTKTSKRDLDQVHRYTSNNLQYDIEVDLTQPGLILIALLAGGDYSPGVPGIGIATAHSCAQALLGEDLIAAWNDVDNRPTRLREWRDNLRRIIREPSMVNRRRNPAKANMIPDTFPSQPIVDLYLHPITSETTGGDTTAIHWPAGPSLADIGRICEARFEWGTRDGIVVRARTRLWEGMVLRLLREVVLAKDNINSTGSGVWTSSPSIATTSSAPSPSTTTTTAAALLSQLTPRIRSTRRHASTQNLLQYRLEIHPAPFLVQITSRLKGSRRGRDEVWDEYLDERSRTAGQSLKNTVDPADTLRIWLPAVMVDLACPELVSAYEARQVRRPRKARRTSGSSMASLDNDGDASSSGPPPGMQVVLSSSNPNNNIIDLTGDTSDDDIIDFTGDALVSGELGDEGKGKAREVAGKGKKRVRVMDRSSEDEVDGESATDSDFSG